MTGALYQWLDSPIYSGGRVEEGSSFHFKDFRLDVWATEGQYKCGTCGVIEVVSHELLAKDFESAKNEAMSFIKSLAQEIFQDVTSFR